MIEWLYPVKCPVCFQIVVPKGAKLHPDCEKKLEYISEPICKKCGRPLPEEEEEYCPECKTTDRGWEEGRSIFFYRGAAKMALKKMKKEGTEEIIRFFGNQMRLRQGMFIRRRKPDCIVPVPLHPSRQRSRGFNQAELLAVALGKETGIPVRCLLKKHKKTKDQKSLGRLERRKNVQHAFRADMEALKGSVPYSVLLVDDVSTTGSTLTACAMALKELGVQQVVFLSVCAGE